MRDELARHSRGVQAHETEVECIASLSDDPERPDVDGASGPSEQLIVAAGG
jgi:hypothetical protein